MSHQIWRCSVALVVLLLGIAFAVGAEEEKPSFFKSLRDRLGGQSDSPGGDAESTNIKDIDKVSKYAAVVLDRECPRLVQPYKLTDNFASLTVFAAKEGFNTLTRMVMTPKGSAKAERIPKATKLAANQLNWLPMAAEVRYGEHLHQEETNTLDRESRLGKRHYPTVDAMLQTMLSQVNEPHEYEFKLFILKNATRNAVARPGGFLYIDQGLVDDPSAHLKAHFALAHEIAHVLQRHETKELQSLVIDSASSRDDLVKLMRGIRKDPGLIVSHVKMGKNRFTRHHIDQELQSDSCAVRLLGRVLPDAQALADSLNAFLRDLPPPEPGEAPATAATGAGALGATIQDIVDSPIKRHPTSDERFKNLRTIYEDVLRHKAAAR